MIGAGTMTDDEDNVNEDELLALPSQALPKDARHLSAIWAFCESPQFEHSVRLIDQSLKVTNATLVNVPFNLSHWQKVAAEKYPHGLPKLS